MEFLGGVVAYLAIFGVIMGGLCLKSLITGELFEDKY